MTETNPSASVEDLFFQAETFAELRDWPSAESMYRKAMALDSSPAARIEYGAFLAEQERYREAISTFTPILDGVDQKAIAVVCHNLAAIYREVGDADLARRFQWRATLMQDSADENDLLAMANDALAIGNDEVAESLVISACEMSDDPIEDCLDGDLIGTTGLAYAASGFTKEALLTLFTAYRRHQAANDLRGIGADLMNMSNLFGDLCRYQAQRKCVLRAIRYFKAAPAPLSLENAKARLDLIDRMETVRSFDARRN